MDPELFTTLQAKFRVPLRKETHLLAKRKKNSTRRETNEMRWAMRLKRRDKNLPGSQHLKVPKFRQVNTPMSEWQALRDELDRGTSSDETKRKQAGDPARQTPVNLVMMLPPMEGCLCNLTRMAEAFKGSSPRRRGKERSRVWTKKECKEHTSYCRKLATKTVQLQRE